MEPKFNVSFDNLNTDHEINLVKMIGKFDIQIEDAAKNDSDMYDAGEVVGCEEKTELVKSVDSIGSCHPSHNGKNAYWRKLHYN